MKSPIPQILLTGSSGYLGQHLLHSLIHEPLKHTNRRNGGKPLAKDSRLLIHALHGGNMEGFSEAVEAIMAKQATKQGNSVKVQVHKLDLTNAADVQAWIDQYAAAIDICVHMAALSMPGKCQEDPAKAQALNVPTVFLEGLAKNAVPIIGLSTDQVYDGTKGGYVATDAVKPLNIYGKTKVELEELLKRLYRHYYGVAMVSLRSSIMLGPKAPILGEKAHATFLHFCAGRENQETTFYTDEKRSVVSVDNVVTVIRWFVVRMVARLTKMDTHLYRVFNLGGPDRVSRLDMAQAVFRHFGYAEDKLIAAEKATTMPPQKVQSPLDITMDSGCLVDLIGDDDIQWKGMEDIVKWTFADSCTAAKKLKTNSCV